MKILLLSTNIQREPEPVYPLGMAYLLGALKKQGLNATCMDLLTEGSGEDVIKKKSPVQIPTLLP